MSTSRTKIGDPPAAVRLSAVLCGRTPWALRTPASILGLLVFAAAAGLGPGARAGEPAAAATPLHSRFTRLLGTHVRDSLVDYEAWHADTADYAALVDYIERLSALDPAAWSRADNMAYWLNLYNAVTVRLILDNYPLDSIKDLAGPLKKSPWDHELVVVAGRRLTLNDIEHDIIRPTFGDPRIHFALNCASLGCPPLQDEAYLPTRLEAQLDAACILAVNRDRWVRVTGDTLYLTKIFDWYGDDFTADGGSVLEFIGRYRHQPLPVREPTFEYMAYDWSLNQAR